MEEALLKELEDLRTENQILRASLEEVRKEEPAAENGPSPIDALIKELSAKLNITLEQAKAQLSEPAGKMTENLTKQMEANPVPVLLAAFGAGYLLSRALDRR